jgi:serine/threonine protein kinase
MDRAGTYKINTAGDGDVGEDVLPDLRASPSMMGGAVSSDVMAAQRLGAKGHSISLGERSMEQPPALCDRAISVGNSSSHFNIVHSHKSLRFIALRSHSRQSNSYISTKELLVSSGLLYSHKSGEKITGLVDEELAAKGSKQRGGSGNSTDDLVASEAHGPVIKSAAEQKKRVRPNLQISIAESKIQDDVDWIQVDDDEDDEDDKPMKPRPSLSIEGNTPQQSYSLTKSGTIFVDGFQGGIGKGGIRTEQKSDLIPLQDRLVFLCRLGAGASGIVYKALDLRDMRLVAIKMIPMFERGKRRQMVRELSALFQLLNQKRADKESRSQNGSGAGSGAGSGNLRAGVDGLGVDFGGKDYIVDFYDAFSNIDEGGVALMMEYMDGGSLQDIVSEGGCDEEPTLASIAQQALVGLSFLHRCKQLHRDLKPGNFLISKRGEVKIADFGILRQMDEAANGPGGGGAGSGGGSSTSPTVGSRSGDDAIPRVQTFVGTATFMSPERIDGQEYSYPSDIWSFGLSLLTVALGKLPIDTEGGYWSILQTIRDEKPPNIPQDDERFSDEFRDFLSCCCQTKPEDRHTAEQLLTHSFLQKAQVGDDVIEGEEDRGRAELAEILFASHEHIERRRAETLSEKRAQERAAADSPETEDSTAAAAAAAVTGSWPLFVGIGTKNTHAMLSTLFFPPDKPAAVAAAPELEEEEPAATASVAAVDKSEFFADLAAQLNLPLTEVVAEIEAFIEKSKSIKITTTRTPMSSMPTPTATVPDAPAMGMVTPKAAHGGRGGR